MSYRSVHLNHEEYCLFQRSLESAVEVLCTSIAQVYTFEPKRMKSWALLSTGVLYLVKTDTNVMYIRLFHLLKKIKEWEEEVYLEMVVHQDRKWALVFEGKKCVVLLNFVDENECKIFRDTFNQCRGKNFFHNYIYEEVDHDNYEEIGADEDHVYEDPYYIPRANLNKLDKKRQEKLEKERRKEENERKKKEEKERKKKEKEMKKREKNEIKLQISSPNAVVHQGHGELTSSGLVFEGIDMAAFFKLMKEAGISNDLYIHNKSFIDGFVDTHKTKINKEYTENINRIEEKILDKMVDRWPSSPDILNSKRYLTDFSTPLLYKRPPIEFSVQEEQDIPPPKPVKTSVSNKCIVDTKPKFIPPKPYCSLKPSLPPKSGGKPTLSKKPLNTVQSKLELPLNSKPLPNSKAHNNPPPIPPSLNKSFENVSVATKESTKDDLLAQIRCGSQLKPIREAKSTNTNSVNQAENKNAGIADVLRMAIQNRNKAFRGAGDDQESDEEDRTYFGADAWQ